MAKLLTTSFVCMGILPNAKGALNVYEMKGGDLDTILEGKTSSGVKCGTLGASSSDSRHIATVLLYINEIIFDIMTFDCSYQGDYAGTLNVYDLDVGNLSKPIFSQQAHASIINAIDGCGGPDNIGYGAPELGMNMNSNLLLLSIIFHHALTFALYSLTQVTGGRDGCVRLWDIRVKEPVLALEPGEGQPIRDCWTVAFGNSFSDEERCIAAGYDNGDVKLFDLRTRY